MENGKLRDSLELVGIVAVILSLALVAYEIRQNTNAVESAVIQSLIESSVDATMVLAENGELRDSYFAAVEGEMTENQRRQMYVYIAAALRIHQNRFEQVKLGMIDLELALSLGGRGGTYRLPYFAEAWEELSPNFPPDFREYVNQNVLPLGPKGE
jgi:hypothetical protein